MSKNKSEPAVAEVVEPYIAEQCTLLLAIGAELQRAFAEERATTLPATRIHQARVACRRLRSFVRTFGDFFETPPAGRLLDDAGWFGTRLAAVRDLDVLGDRLRTAMAGLDNDLVLHHADTELGNQLRQRRQIALAVLRDALHDQAYDDLLQQLRSWQHEPAWAPTAEEPASKIKKPVKRAEARFDRRLRHATDAIRADDPEADELIHRARKAARRHRYAVEAARPALGSSADRTISSRKRLQDLLGDYQDSRMAADLLRDLGGIPGRNGFTFGILHAHEAEHRRRLRKKIAKSQGN